MRPVQLLNKVQRRISDLLALRDLSNHTELQSFAETAFDTYCEWFGTPADAEWPYTLWQGNYSMCHRSAATRTYAIYLDRTWFDTDTPDNRARRIGELAHEMYHRVVWNIQGLRQESWVDEMIAISVSQRFLRQNGFGNYAMRQEGACRCAIKAPNSQLRDLQRLHIRHDWMQMERLKAYGNSLVCLAAALESIVGWEHLHHLVYYSNWGQWLTSLPQWKRPLVCRLLADADPAIAVECDCEVSDDPLDARSHRELAIAYYRRGDFPQALVECQTTMALAPGEVEDCRYLGLIYADSHEMDQAIVAFERALELEPDDAQTHYNLGTAYFELGNWRSAITEYSIAATLKPDASNIRTALDIAKRRMCERKTHAETIRFEGR